MFNNVFPQIINELHMAGHTNRSTDPSLDGAAAKDDADEGESCTRHMCQC